MIVIRGLRVIERLSIVKNGVQISQNWTTDKRRIKRKLSTSNK